MQISKSYDRLAAWYGLSHMSWKRKMQHKRLRRTPFCCLALQGWHTESHCCSCATSCSAVYVCCVPQREGNVLMSFNNRPATDSIPFLSPFLAPSARAVGPLLDQLATSPFRAGLENVSDALRGLSPGLVKQLLPIFDQLTPIYMDVAQVRWRGGDRGKARVWGTGLRQAQGSGYRSRAARRVQHSRFQCSGLSHVSGAGDA